MILCFSISEKVMEKSRIQIPQDHAKVTTRSDSTKRKKAEEEIKSKNKDGQERRIKSKKSTGTVRSSIEIREQLKADHRELYAQFFNEMVEGWTMD